jgi:murein DD-endopeptidase MepM/ murein hydrolase activator NlpD
VLPNGRPSFRVTQRFNDWDAVLQNGRHGALDLGNFHCGDAVIACLAGDAVPLADPNGAIGVELQHDNGYRTQYWHLSQRAVQFGRVAKGATIGYVGDTGLNVSGCHLHFVVIDKSSNPTDPWPLLDQNRPSPDATIVPWHAIMYSIGYPNIRQGIGGKVIGQAKPGQTFESISIYKKGPIYVDPRNGKKRTDWVKLTGDRSIAKAFLKTRTML